MFYSRTIKIALANITVSDGVSQSPKRGEGADPVSCTSTACPL